MGLWFRNENAEPTLLFHLQQQIIASFSQLSIIATKTDVLAGFTTRFVQNEFYFLVFLNNSFDSFSIKFFVFPFEEYSYQWNRLYIFRMVLGKRKSLSIALEHSCRKKCVFWKIKTFFLNFSFFSKSICNQNTIWFQCFRCFYFY